MAADGVATSAGPSIEYVPLDAPAGASQAVIVQGHALAHTRQLLALDASGKLVGQDSLELQVEQVLDNLAAVLESAKSGLEQLVRVNIYAMSPEGVSLLQKKLGERLPPAVRPTYTSVLTPLPDRHALVAVDAVAVAQIPGSQVSFLTCAAMGGDHGCADVAVLPRGGVAYLSGMPAEADLTQSAVEVSMAGLWSMLTNLQLTPDQIVHIKVFLRPASSAADVLQELKQFFPGKSTPPVVFVEWLAPPPVEIEMVVQRPLKDQAKSNVEYYNPPEVRPLQIFSKAALVNTDRQIYLAGLYAKKPGGDEAQSLDVFGQLQSILAKTGSDMLHMAKGTYYVIDDGSARGMDRARLWLYDQDRPPAASKCMVHGVGMAGRKLTLDMIAVSAK